jgi:hypothetical protein
MCEDVRMYLANVEATSKCDRVTHLQYYTLINYEIVLL